MGVPRTAGSHIATMEGWEAKGYFVKSDGKYYQAKDLFRKVSVWDYLQEGVAGYSYYRITEGERPDVVAARLYGDSTLYWTFFLVNENLQDFNDWPKSNLQFMKFMDRIIKVIGLIHSKMYFILIETK